MTASLFPVILGLRVEIYEQEAAFLASGVTEGDLITDLQLAPGGIGTSWRHWNLIGAHLCPAGVSCADNTSLPSRGANGVCNVRTHIWGYPNPKAAPLHLEMMLLSCDTTDLS